MIVVTGALGFIGSNLLCSLEKRGYTKIIGVDNFGNESKWKNVSKRSYVYFVFPDQLKSFMQSNVGNIRAVIHLGGITSTTETNVDSIVKTNIHLTIDLYQFCKENGIQFIYASSASTYGDGSMGFEDKEDVDYLCSLSPLNAYGWSKCYIDKFIVLDRERNRTRSQVVGLKFFNVYGPNEYHKGNQTSVVYKFYREILNTHMVNLFKSHKEEYNDGCQKRDFVYVQDCTNVILWFLEHPVVSGLFNIGSGQARTFNDVANLTIEFSGINSKINYVDMPEVLTQHYQYYTLANIEKLRSVGYLEEMTSLEKGIKLYVEGFLKNLQYKNILIYV